MDCNPSIPSTSVYMMNYYYPPHPATYLRYKWNFNKSPPQLGYIMSNNKPSVSTRVYNEQ